jgi:hypothetical protein
MKNEFVRLKRDRSDMLKDFKHLKNKCLQNELTMSRILRDQITVKECCHSIRDLLGELRSTNILKNSNHFESKFHQLNKWVNEIGEDLMIERVNTNTFGTAGNTIVEIVNRPSMLTNASTDMESNAYLSGPVSPTSLRQKLV